MSRSLDADYTRTYLMPPAVDDWIPADHPARFVRSFVERFTRAEWGLPEESPIGRPGYDDELLLKIWIYGYSIGLRSSRALERACKELVPMMWLAGEHRPDHNTLWRFWRDHQGTVGRVFELGVDLSERLGLITFDLHALDGTKIRACGSTHQVTSKAELEKRRERARQIRIKIEREILEQHEREANEAETGRLQGELQDRKRLEEKIDEFLGKIDPDRRQNLSEPEARVMKGCGLGYNAQAVVDAGAGLIIAQDLVTDVNDQHQLVPMLDKVQERFGRTAGESVADGGFNNQQALAEAEEKGYSVLLGTASGEPNDPSEKPFHASRFSYEPAEDVIICPQGKTLTFERIVKRRSGPARVFRGRECSHCPVRNDCTSDRRGRSIDLLKHHEAAVRQRLKRGDPEKRALYRRRLPLAERPFALIKSILKFDRFRSRGKANAAIEWKFMCGIHNLRILAPLLGPA